MTNKFISSNPFIDVSASHYVTSQRASTHLRNYSHMDSRDTPRQAEGLTPRLEAEGVDERLADQSEYDHSLRHAPDLKFLASANFLSDSLTESPLWQQSPVALNAFTNANTRRYSGHGRARPRLAIYMDAAPILEDGLPLPQSPVFSNTPRSRNSFHFGKLSIYTPTNAPPMQPGLRSTSPVRSASPSRAGRHLRSKSPVRRSQSPTKYLPFNFKPQEIMLQSNGLAQLLTVKPAHRKGHKYKHSSVSMNLFQEPPPALNVNLQQDALPDSYPIPTIRETVASLTSSQKLKLVWLAAHLALSGVVMTVGHRWAIACFSTLAHLVFYDALGSLVMVFVDIMSNFDVWNKPLVAYPFGLGRIEVLLGFALSASLIMVGCDLVSHFFEELVMLLVVDDDDHAAHSHHIHASDEVDFNAWVYALVLVLVLGVIVVTTRMVQKDRINDMISDDDRRASVVNQKSGLLETSSSFQKTPSSLKKTLAPAWTAVSKNPARLVTLVYVVYLLVVPLLSPYVEGIDLNEVTTLTVACLLCYVGWRLVKTLGGTLLLSYPYSDYEYHVLKSTIIDKMLLLECFKDSYKVDQIFVTKFNYELYVVGLKVAMRTASADDELRLRFEVNRLIRREIGEDSRVEITIDLTRY